MALLMRLLEKLRDVGFVCRMRPAETASATGAEGKAAWVISVDLGEVDWPTASEWMDVILDTVYQRGRHFSGTVSMDKVCDDGVDAGRSTAERSCPAGATGHE